MRIGICSWSFARVERGTRPVTEIAALAAELGFEMIEGAFSSRGSLAPGRIDAEPTAIPVRSLTTLDLHRFRLTDPSPKGRGRGLERLRQMIEIARPWGVRSISFSPGPAHSDDTVDKTVGALADGLEPLAALAATHGVGLALENLPGHLLSTRDRMALALARMPTLGLCLDLGNTLVDPPLAAWVDRLGPRVTKLHLSDGHTDGTRLVPALPGQGALDWNVVGQSLDKLQGTDAYVEVPRPRGVEERAFVESLREALQRVVPGAMS